jgi:hypothetical protein
MHTGADGRRWGYSQFLVDISIGKTSSVCMEDTGTRPIRIVEFAKKV